MWTEFGEIGYERLPSVEDDAALGAQFGANALSLNDLLIETAAPDYVKMDIREDACARDLQSLGLVVTLLP